MSHFKCLVFAPEGKTLSDMLSPFDENNEDLYEFIDVTDEYLKRYKNESVDAVKVDGKLYCKWDDKFFYKGEYKYPEGACFLEAPFKDIYSFDGYMTEFRDFIKRIDRYGYEANPNAKWDWWVEGGRFMTRIKTGAEVTRCGLADLDVSPTQDDIKEYHRIWKDAMEGKLWTGLKRWYLNRYEDEDNYIKEMKKGKPFAFISPDGKWYENEEMLGFGFTIFDKKKYEVTDKAWTQVLKSDPSTTVYCVDCHI